MSRRVRLPSESAKSFPSFLRGDRSQSSFPCSRVREQRPLICYFRVCAAALFLLRGKEIVSHNFQRNRDSVVMIGVISRLKGSVRIWPLVDSPPSPPVRHVLPRLGVDRRFKAQFSSSTYLKRRTNETSRSNSILVGLLPRRSIGARCRKEFLSKCSRHRRSPKIEKTGTRHAGER